MRAAARTRDGEALRALGLAETQHALARLYTETALRERFFADPLGVGAELGLHAEEARQLAQISAQKTDYFAATLVNKRLGEVSKLLPHTARVLGQQFRKLFREYAAQSLPAGSKKHLEDAVGFALFARRSARLAECAPPWIGELLRYETECLRAGEPRPLLRLRRFRYPVLKLTRTLAETGAPPALEEQTTYALWFRPSRRSRLRHRVLSLSR